MAKVQYRPTTFNTLHVYDVVGDVVVLIPVRHIISISINFIIIIMFKDFKNLNFLIPTVVNIRGLKATRRLNTILLVARRPKLAESCRAK